MDTKTSGIRQSFLNYFRNEKHTFIPPSKVYLENDNTLLFVNAGMNQLKKVFLGEIDTSTLKNTKLMNSQICIRAGGKHNDLDDVGDDSYHLTSFEMLGNWSLGMYDKETAVKCALDFLISCGLNKKFMYVTYFHGFKDENIQLDEDNESKNIWGKFIDGDRIIPGNIKDNFWMMGDNGPCGPCTEIHYDIMCRENNGAAHLVNKDDPTVIEIWNIVFMMFNKNNNEYKKLDKLYIDTGMGLERLAMIIQNKSSIYEIDIFRKLISYAQIVTNGEYYTNIFDKNNINFKFDKTSRIFADHMRTVIISLYQGLTFGANGRSYVLRKIFRRMLNSVYINYNLLNNQELITENGVMDQLIIDILTYFQIKKLDAINAKDTIKNIMVDEERHYKAMLQTVNPKYKKYTKKYGDYETVREKMHQDIGIDGDIIDFVVNRNL